MNPGQGRVALRIRLSDARLRELKTRAMRVGSDTAVYAEMVLRFQAHGGGGTAGGEAPAGAGDEVYFPVTLSAVFKARLMELAGRRTQNVAAVAGALIGTFLRRFDRDPREFRMIHQVSQWVEERGSLSSCELREAVACCEPLGAGGLSGAFAERWFYSRLQPLVGRVRDAGVEAPFTLELMSRVLAESIQPRAGAGGSGAE